MINLGMFTEREKAIEHGQTMIRAGWVIVVTIEAENKFVIWGTLKPTLMTGGWNR